MQQSLEVGNIGLEEHKSLDVFSMEASSAVRARVTSRAEKMLIIGTLFVFIMMTLFGRIRIDYSDHYSAPKRIRIEYSVHP